MPFGGKGRLWKLCAHQVTKPHMFPYATAPQTRASHWKIADFSGQGGARERDEKPRNPEGISRF